MTGVEDAARAGEKSPAEPRRIRLDRAKRRETLLDAGARAFAERGFQGTSMEEVGTTAGVTRLIVYRHFDSKEVLYKAVLDRAVKGLSEAVAAHLVDGPTVRGVVVGFLEAARRDPDGFRLLVRQAAREPGFAEYSDEFRARAKGSAQDLIREAVPDATLRSWAAATLVSLLEEATLSWVESGDARRDEEMIEVLSSSIAAMIHSFPAGS